MIIAFNKPQIVSQHIDTLVTTHKLKDPKQLHAYQHKLMILEKYKEEAQQVSGESRDRFVIYDLCNLGKFKIFAQGVGVYRYRLENEDFTVVLGDIKTDSNRATASIRYKQQFLVVAGHIKAYKLVKAFVNKFIGETFDSISEIHLATDLWGVRYDYTDLTRFQTKFKRSDFSKGYIASLDMLNIQSVGGRTLETITFGKNEFMFRIYDKLKEVSKKPCDALIIKQRWIINGFKEELGAKVWRHEIQLRGTHLKKHIAPNQPNEVLYIFNKLHDLWSYALSKIEFINLTREEIMRCHEATLTATIVKICQRAKKETRVNHFNEIRKWWDILCGQFLTYGVIKESKQLTAEKAAKMLVSSAYKANGIDYKSVTDTLDSTSKKLKQYEGIDLHEYGCKQVVDSFLKNEIMILKLGIILPTFHEDSKFRAQRAYAQLHDSISNTNHSVLRRFEKFTSISTYKQSDNKAVNPKNSSNTQNNNQQSSNEQLIYDGCSDVFDDNLNAHYGNTQNNNINDDEIPF